MQFPTTGITLALAFLASGCGGGGGGDGGGGSQPTVSAGLKIFVTQEVHSGDFANDSTLPGSTAVQKADAFCNASSSKPTNDIYRALIVDGVDRDAVTLKNWVLRPNTAYFQVFDNVRIDTTTNAATFAASFREMPSAVCPGCTSSPGVWTGIGDGGTFAETGGSCARWGQAGSIAGFNGSFGSPTSRGTFAFFSGGSSAQCSSVQLALYCVQQ